MTGTGQSNFTYLKSSLKFYSHSVFYCFRNAPGSQLIPNPESNKAHTSTSTCHEFCSKEKCIIATKRIQSISPRKQNLLRETQSRSCDIKVTSEVAYEIKQYKNIENEEKCTQTLLEAAECRLSCPVLKEVGVKTDCYRVILNSLDKDSTTSGSTNSVINNCGEIVRRLCAKSDTEDEILDNTRTGSSRSKTSKGSKSLEFT